MFKKSFAFSGTRAIACSTILASLVTAPAQASPHTSHVIVHYGDLNISGQVGAETLLGRLRRAVKQVCGAPPNNADLSAVKLYQACARPSMDDAIAMVHEPTVLDIYRQSGGR